jgi:hypothetical protein
MAGAGVASGWSSVRFSLLSYDQDGGEGGIDDIGEEWLTSSGIS